MPTKRRRLSADKNASDQFSNAQADHGAMSRRPLTHIVTVCVRGSDMDPPPDTEKRTNLLSDITEALTERTAWPTIDAVVLPGGYFRLPRFVGALGHERRCGSIARSDAGRACASASSSLSERWPGITLCVGLDSFGPTKEIGGDQMIAAWRDGKIIALARKIFPVDADTNREKRIFAVNAEDFASPHRLVTLSNGAQAALCACYDAFGLRSMAFPELADLKAIRTILESRIKTRPADDKDRERFLGAWRALAKAHKPDLALVAIHRFQRPGQEGLWQRHGLAGASATLGGGPAVGAAHFIKRLPREPSDSPLAACDVPLAHLRKGARRQAHMRAPQGSLRVVSKRGKDRTLIRLFSFPASN